MCASHSLGLDIIQSHFDNVMTSLYLFLNDKNDIKFVLFPAATVLLDLTANESFVENVATFLYEKGMFNFLFKKVRDLLDFSDGNEYGNSQI